MELRGYQQNNGRSSSRATGGMLKQQTEATDPADTNEPSATPAGFDGLVGAEGFEPPTYSV